MYILIVFLVIAKLANSSTNEINIDVVTSGAPVQQPENKQVTVKNDYEFSLTVFWGFNATQEHLLFEIEPSESVEFSTYNGHSFFATDSEDHTKVLNAFSINEGTQNVTIKPKAFSLGTQRTSPVTLVGRKSDSVTAKFRCLCTEADYYYEDGIGGSYQGTLTMGKEASRNSYEGHVFFFTEKGNKSNEYSRFTLTQSTVRLACMSIRYELILISRDDFVII